MTEDSLVAALREICEARASDASPGPRKIVLGIGDDAAAWQPSRSHLSVITTDALVDGVHFRSADMDAGDIGHRAMAANLSDIAAMGARAVLATVALGVTPEMSEAWLRSCYTAMAALAHAHGARIVGGDITASPVISLAISVVGEVSRTRMKTRAGGRPGDVLAVTGPLGASRAGLELLRRGGLGTISGDERVAAERAFARPTPRMREGRFLGASAYVRAMMDSSDGLSTDVARLARASGCGATLDDVPIHLAAFAVAEEVGENPARYALDGGEDFELIVAVAPRAFSHLARKYTLAFGAPLLPIGRLDAEPGIRIATDGDARELVAAGFDHLTRAVGVRTNSAGKIFRAADEQMSFARVNFDRYAKTTRRATFLGEMDRILPWEQLVAIVRPHYPSGEGGRPPIDLERMLRIHFLQQWFNLSDPGVEEGIYESVSMRKFAGIDLGKEGAPGRDDGVQVSSSS